MEGAAPGTELAQSMSAGPGGRTWGLGGASEDGLHGFQSLPLATPVSLAKCFSCSSCLICGQGVMVPAVPFRESRPCAQNGWLMPLSLPSLPAGFGLIEPVVRGKLTKPSGAGRGSICID